MWCTMFSSATKLCSPSANLRNKAQQVTLPLSHSRPRQRCLGWTVRFCKKACRFGDRKRNGSDRRSGGASSGGSFSKRLSTPPASSFPSSSPTPQSPNKNLQMKKSTKSSWTKWRSVSGGRASVWVRPSSLFPLSHTLSSMFPLSLTPSSMFPLSVSHLPPCSVSVTPHFLSFQSQRTIYFLDFLYFSVLYPEYPLLMVNFRRSQFCRE